MKIAVSSIKRRWLRRLAIVLSYPLLAAALALQTAGLILLKLVALVISALLVAPYGCLLNLWGAVAQLHFTAKEQWK